MFTITDAIDWASAHTDKLDSKRLACEDPTVQCFNRTAPKLSKQLWDSGCWLAERLREHGASDEDVQKIQMAHGQRAFGGDAWQAAVDCANEFAATGDTVNKSRDP